MDAVKFIEERNRMCGTMSEMWGVDAAQIVKNTEEWSAAHPRKTRQSEFLKHYPGARITIDGYLHACPIDVFSDIGFNCDARNCFECKKAFWLAEVEE
jgi:hypothetical protein